MITEVSVKNYKSLRDVKVTLGDLTVLVGRNGAGKSAFVDVLKFIRDALTFNLETAISHRNGISKLIHGFTNDQYPRYFEISAKMGDPLYHHQTLGGSYRFRVDELNQNDYQVTEEDCKFKSASFERRGNRLATTGLYTHITDSTMNVTFTNMESTSLALPLARTLESGLLDALYQMLIHSRFYSPVPEDLRLPQRQFSPDALHDTANNLAACLQHILNSAWGDDLKRTFQRITGVADLQVEQFRSYLYIQTKHEMPEGSSVWFELGQESDGTIRILALLVALYQDLQDMLLVIEEPELSLHPGALSVLAGVIKEASLRNQIIITTQSPDLISEFPIATLRVVENRQGSTVIGPLLPEQIEAINRDLFTTGDLLRIEGLRTTPFEPVSADNA